MPVKATGYQRQAESVSVSSLPEQNPIENQACFQAIDAHLEGVRGTNFKAHAFLSAIGSVIENKLQGTSGNAGRTCGTAFSNVFAVGPNQFILHRDRSTPSPATFHPADIRTAEEVALHVLIQSHLRANGFLEDVNSAESLAPDEIRRLAKAAPVPAHSSQIVRPSKRHRDVDMEGTDSKKRRIHSTPIPDHGKCPERAIPQDKRRSNLIRLKNSVRTGDAPALPAARAPGHPRKIDRGLSPNSDSTGAGLVPKNYQSADGHFLFYDANARNGHFSNFWVGTPIEIRGERWVSVEHYFQAAKYEVLPGDANNVRDAKLQIRAEIKAANTPAETKAIAYRRGQGRFFTANWDERRVTVMRDAIQAKFTQDSSLGEALLATGAGTLIESMPANRSDTFWGMKGKTGKNMLGKILMEVRSALASAA